MKISELIESLSLALKEHGDIEVCAESSGGEYAPQTVEYSKVIPLWYKDGAKTFIISSREID